ncbi:MAG: hypothetical protein KAI43_13245 [Candidatus Aureabacteria bacterium]|nr:hypothetical protein [Candidatus Auribacterota bacterium]
MKPNITNTERNVFFWLRVISMFFLFLAIFKLPYSYYMFLRVVICASGCYLFYIAHQFNSKLWKWIFGIMVFLFNPFLPVHLTKALWVIFDLFTGCVIYYSFYSLGVKADKIDKNREHIEEIKNYFKTLNNKNIFSKIRLQMLMVLRSIYNLLKILLNKINKIPSAYFLISFGLLILTSYLLSQFHVFTESRVIINPMELLMVPLIFILLSLFSSSILISFIFIINKIFKKSWKKKVIFKKVLMISNMIWATFCLIGFLLNCVEDKSSYKKSQRPQNSNEWEQVGNNNMEYYEK